MVIEPQRQSSPDDVLRIMAQINNVFADASRDVRSRPGVARALHDSDVRGNEHGSEFVAFMEVHSDGGPYACFWFEFGYAGGQWLVEAAVHAASEVGAPTATVARFPEVACADVDALQAASTNAVEWLTDRVRTTDYLRLS